MKKLPYGISDYEKIIENNYYYVDKTPYIEKLENIAETYIMFLRPRKFGKTLFTSTLENYYDIKKNDKFKQLFEKTKTSPFFINCRVAPIHKNQIVKIKTSCFITQLAKLFYNNDVIYIGKYNIPFSTFKSSWWIIIGLFK